MSLTKWEEVRIKDLGKVITGKTPPTSEEKYFNGEYLFISPKDMSFESRYINKSLTSITLESIKKFKNQVIPKNSIMYTSLSYGFGKIGIASTSCLTNQQINTVVVDEEKYDFNFIYYLLRNSKDYFLTFNAGIVTPIISKSTFEKIKIKVVKDLTIQKKIAKKLSNYDDLIENNQKSIELLEKKARLTYEEWFLRFRIDGKKLDIDEDTGLPFGWEKKELKNFGKVVIGKTPSTANENYYNGNIPFIKTPSMHSNPYVIEVEDYLTQRGANSQQNKFLPKNSLVVSCIGSVGVYALVSQASQTNQQINAIKFFKKEYIFYLYCFAFQFENILESIGSGSTMTNVNKKKFEEIKVVMPSMEILSKFYNLVKNNFEQILNLQKQNQKLKEARDILLPRLMSGMIEL